MRSPAVYVRQLRAGACLDAMALVACLALPLALLHARALAEILTVGIDLLFLRHVISSRDTAWLRLTFTWAACAWWLWLVLCSALGTGGLVLGLAAIRFPLLSVALGDWLLTRREAVLRQRMLWWVLAAAIAWIGVESWQQYLTGTNLFGQPRWVDGALTGPFNKPRAGPAYILLFFPVVIPATMTLWARHDPRHRVAALLLAVVAVSIMVLIGQRMPNLLMVLGLAITLLLLPRMRLAVLTSGVAGLLLLAALPWLSPATNDKLVVHFADQLRHFADSDYGLIFVRGYTLAELHPWLGSGFDGFRRGCSEFWTMHGIDWLGIRTFQLNGGMRACNLHPHNYYLEAVDNAGLPGLASFMLMVSAALARLGSGLARDRNASRTGLFVGAVVAFWPVASTSSLGSMPNGGWVFLLLGAGFAAEAGTRRAKPRFGQAASDTAGRAAGGATDMSDETTTDHGFIRAWAEARDGRPGMLEGRVSASGAPLLRFDFGTPEAGLTEMAWDEFFQVFETDMLALEFRETPGLLSRFYKLVPRVK